jgi:hypothetical protein
MQFLDPTNPNPDRRLAVPVLARTTGARLAFLNNGWLSMKKIGEFIEGPLREQHGIADLAFHAVPRNMEPPDGLLDRIAAEYDAAIVGLAN